MGVRRDGQGTVGVLRREVGLVVLNPARQRRPGLLTPADHPLRPTGHIPLPLSTDEVPLQHVEKGKGVEGYFDTT